MANLNEQPGKPHTYTLEQLRKIKAGANVFSSDGIHLGDALHLHQRLEEVNRALKLYEFYLECSRFEMGNSGFIPTDFIDHVDPDTGTVTLSVPMSDFLAERWDISPSFIAHDLGRSYPLAKTAA